MLWRPFRAFLHSTPKTTRRQPIRKRPTTRLVLETLENRITPSTLTVVNANDSGDGSFWQRKLACRGIGCGAN